MPHRLSKPDDVCEEYYTELNTTLSRLVDYLYNIQGLLDNNGNATFHKNDLLMQLQPVFTVLERYREVYKSVRDKCLEQYFAWLDGIHALEARVKSQRETFYYRVNVKFDTKVKEIMEDEMEFNDIIYKYIDIKNISVKDLQRKWLTSKRLNDYDARQKALISKIKQQITDFLYNKDSIATAVETWYELFLTYAFNVSAFVTQNEVIRRVGDLSIWKMPVANLMNQLGYMYLNNNELCNRSDYDWSGKFTISHNYIDMSYCHVEEYVKTITTHLNSIEAKLDGLEQELSTKLRDLRDDMDYMRTASKIDELFVR